MKLFLDHTQRLNLHALMGAQRADLGTIRALWAIQDRIALNTDEEQAVEAKREIVDGKECVVWNPERSIPAKDFDFSELEIAKIKNCLESWQSYGASADRRWLEPLLQAVFLTEPK